ncbi:MAG: type I-E CRISPR-associated protein Cse2/CasB [Polyangiaceae bacterium]
MSDEAPDKTDRIHDFIRAIGGHVKEEDRGALAALRRSLTDEHGMAAQAAPYVVPYLPADSSNAARDRAFFLVGALYALHPAHVRGKSLAQSYRELCLKRSPDGKITPAMQARFVALLDAHPEDVGEHVRHAVGLLKSQEISIDYEKLLRDLVRFDRPDRRVQRDWARDFWASDSEQAPTPSPKEVSP